MHIITGRHLPRRTFLRGLGASVALPFLDAMAPARERWTVTRARTAMDRTRLVAIEMVHGSAGSNAWGASQHLWSPPETGRGFDFGPSVLSALEPYRDPSDHRQRHRRRGRRGDEAEGDRRRPLPVQRDLPSPRRTPSRQRAPTCGWAPRSTRCTPSASARTPPSRPCSSASRTWTRLAGAPTATPASTPTRSRGRPPTSPSPWSGIRASRSTSSSVPAARPRRGRRGGGRSASVLDFIVGEVNALKRQLDPVDGRRVDRYLNDIREIERRIARVVARNESGEERELPGAPAGGAGLLRRARQADVRPAGARLPGGRDRRLLVQDGPRRLEPGLPRERCRQGLPPVRRTTAADPRTCSNSQRSTATTWAWSPTSWTGSRAFREGDGTPSRQDHGRLRLADGRLERPQPQALPTLRGRRRQRPHGRQPTPARGTPERRWPTSCSA